MLASIQFFFFLLAVADPLHARYLIAHKLASGGFGDVYAGVRKKDGMPVALKVIPKKRVREINTVSQSNIISIFFFNFFFFSLMEKSPWKFTYYVV